jgi:di/tricarboxylate transporter
VDWQGWLTLSLMLGALATLILSKVGPHLIMMGVLLVLSVSGVLTAKEALAGFSNEGLLTVAAMFVVATGIHASGGVDLLVKHLLGHPAGVRQAQARIVAPIIGLSAFLNNTPVVATMIPAVNAWAKKLDISPSKLMIPLSYAAILGGTITLIGTSTNLVVNGQYQTLTGNPGFSLFSITPIGLPVAVVAFLFMIWWFPRALPDHREDTAFANMREFTLEVAVAHNGPLVGKTIAEAGLRHLKRVYLVEIERDGHIVTAVPTEEKLRGGDRLVFAGDVQAIADLLRINGIVASTSDDRPLMTQNRAERRLVEAVISPHSDCIGDSIRDSQFRDRYGAVVLAVARNGERVPGNLGSIRLQAGDTLLLEARPAFVSRQRHTKDFLLVNDLDDETPRHKRAWLSWGILLTLVGLASFEVISMLNAALLGAAAMILTGCCSSSQAQKSLDLTVILTIAASFALGAALQKTGVAAWLAANVVALSHGDALLLLILTYITISVMTEIISNNAAAVLMLPIVIEMTTRAHLNLEPFVFAIMMGASASFATPLGYQTNLMVYGPGNYRFKDFLKVGIPMNIVVGIASVTMIAWLYELRA